MLRMAVGFAMIYGLEMGALTKDVECGAARQEEKWKTIEKTHGFCEGHVCWLLV